MNVETVYNGILAGIVYSLSGYFKNKPKGHDFDYKKFGDALYLGVASGLITAFANVDLDQAQLISAQVGIVALLKNIVHGVATYFTK